MEKNLKLNRGAVDALQEIRDLANLISEEAQVRLESKSLHTDAELFRLLNATMKKIQEHIARFEKCQAPSKYVQHPVFGGHWVNKFQPPA